MNEQLVQEFEGFVEYGSITENEFRARLYDITNIPKAKIHNEYHVKIPINKISKEERKNIQEGFLFDLRIYKEEGKKGFIDRINFRCEKWTEEDSILAIKCADQMMKELGIK